MRSATGTTAHEQHQRQPAEASKQLIGSQCGSEQGQRQWGRGHEQALPQRTSEADRCVGWVVGSLASASKRNRLVASDAASATAETRPAGVLLRSAVAETTSAAQAAVQSGNRFTAAVRDCVASNQQRADDGVPGQGTPRLLQHEHPDHQSTRKRPLTSSTTREHPTKTQQRRQCATFAAVELLFIRHVALKRYTWQPSQHEELERITTNCSSSDEKSLGSVRLLSRRHENTAVCRL